MEKEEFEAFEEDFDAKPAQYEVWLLAYDDNYAITDYDRLIQSFSDPEAAVEFAKNYVDNERYKEEKLPGNIAYIEVLVETVVEFEEHTENVGTLFTATIDLIL